MSEEADAAARVESVEDPPKALFGGKGGELVVVLVLGLTALATAWSGYQASLWDGIQSSSYTQASGARTDAAQQRSEANQFRIADLTIFENYIDALLRGDTETEDFYRERFGDELGVAYDAWSALDPLNNPDAPHSPLAMPEYQLTSDQNAEDLEARAHSLFEDGEAANTYSDVYTLTTLLFAAALFFAAIAERFESARARMALLVLAGIGLIAGVSIALGQPITGG